MEKNKNNGIYGSIAFTIPISANITQKEQHTPANTCKKRAPN
jgi:hypothetical protein